MENKIKFIIADDHKIVREGLTNLIEKNKNYKVIAEAADGLEAIKLTKSLNPDIIIMDLSMPNMNGIDATIEIKAMNDKIKIIALSMHSEQRFIKEAMKAGANGYLLKDCAFDELLVAINNVIEGKAFLSSKIADVVINQYIKSNSDKEDNAFQILTSREREVLQLLAEGNSTKDIATKLNISVKTVETHRSQIMQKLDIHSVAGLTKYAIKEGIIEI